jgi:hypothetical protein
MAHLGSWESSSVSKVQSTVERECLFGKLVKNPCFAGEMSYQSKITVFLVSCVTSSQT